MKSQGVRLIDVFILLIHLSGQNKFSQLENDLLGLTGLLTITYNANNYLKIQKERPARVA